MVSLSLGTSSVVFATTDGPVIEPDGRLHAFCHSVPGEWHLMGVMLSVAGSLRWHRDTFAPNTDYDALLEPVAGIPPGSDVLFFLPYLTGEGTPHPDPLARRAFVAGQESEIFRRLYPLCRDLYPALKATFYSL